VSVLHCRGLLFDSDGVLVDSDASVVLSWSRWAREHGLDPDQVMEVVHGRRSRDTVARLIGPAERAAALDTIDRYEVEDAATVAALPGAAELLGSLPEHAWAVVTSGTRPLALARLVAAGLPRPAVLVTADEVTAGKPEPAGYLTAAEALGLAPADCVVLEDSPAGVAAGRAAGAVVLGVSERALATDADVVVRDLRGLRWDGERLTIPDDGLLRG
jgi:mannitol-1-/sugar-/sorbitol-6-phosphatase